MGADHARRDWRYRNDFHIVAAAPHLSTSALNHSPSSVRSATCVHIDEYRVSILSIQLQERAGRKQARPRGFGGSWEISGE